MVLPTLYGCEASLAGSTTWSKVLDSGFWDLRQITSRRSSVSSDYASNFRHARPGSTRSSPPRTPGWAIRHIPLEPEVQRPVSQRTDESSEPRSLESRAPSIGVSTYPFVSGEGTLG